jgi:hypothetical protein
MMMCKSQLIMPKDIELQGYHINDILYFNFTVMHCNG